MELIDRDTAKRLLIRARARAQANGQDFDSRAFLSRIKQRNDTAVTFNRANPERENAVNSERNFGEFNGVLDNPIVEGLGTAADFLGGAVRTVGAQLADPFTENELVTNQDLVEALNPLDRKDAVSSAELIRRFQGDTPKKGEIETSDVAGFALDIATDPLSYLTLGVLPAAKVAAKVLKTPAKVASKVSRGTTKGLGLLSGRSGDVLDNFIDNAKEIRELKDPSKIDELFDSTLGAIDKGTTTKIQKAKADFAETLKSKKEVDISEFKNQVNSLKAEFSPNKAVNQLGLEEANSVQKLVNSILEPAKPKKSNLSDVELPEGFIADSGPTAIPDKVSGTQANKIHQSLQAFRRIGPEATPAQKLVAGRINKIAKNLREDISGKDAAKNYKRDVIDLQDDVSRRFGSAFKDTIKKRKSKLQTTLKSGSRDDNFALRNELDELSKLTNTDLNRAALDIRTLDILNSGTGRLREATTQGNVFRAAANAVIDPAFNTAVRANDLTQSVLNNGGGAALNLATQRGAANSNDNESIRNLIQNLLGN